MEMDKSLVERIKKEKKLSFQNLKLLLYVNIFINQIRFTFSEK